MGNDCHQSLSEPVASLFLSEPRFDDIHRPERMNFRSLLQMEEGEGGRARQRCGARITGVVPSSQREELRKNVRYSVVLVPLRFPAPCC